MPFVYLLELVVITPVALVNLAWSAKMASVIVAKGNPDVDLVVHHMIVSVDWCANARNAPLVYRLASDAIRNVLRVPLDSSVVDISVVDVLLTLRARVVTEQLIVNVD